jgi:hypothetical protein
MSYTSTQRFVKLTDYLLLEYNYTSSPTPEQYFVNAGSPAVGFEKIVNGYFDNAVQILNKPVDQSVTNNVRDLSVVRTAKNRFVSLDEDYLVQYLNFDPKLTSVANLPVVFPSNIGVYYDTVKFHIVAGYNFDNIDGIILQIQFQERTGKKATVLQLLVTKSDVTLPILNPNPIYLGGALYDHYVEVKIPAYANMVYEYDILAGTSAQANTLAAKISSDGNGFKKDAPVEFVLYEISQTVLKDGYDNYIAQVKAELGIFPKDTYSSLAAVIQQNSFYNYLEYYPTWEGNFLEDFINGEGRVGNSYYVVHEIELKEQVGLTYITTYNFSTTQTQDFNAPYIFRPVLQNPLTTSFLVNYTMRLVNRSNQNQIIRRSSFSSFDITKYGREVNKITLTTGAYSQKVYNKIVQAPNVLSPYGINSNVASPKEKKVPVFYKDNNISVTQETIVIGKDGSLISESSVPNATTVYGQGKAKIVIDPFDNFYKFTVYNITGGQTPEILDLGNSLTYYLVFLDASGQSVRVENIKNKTTISNPSSGQISFKLVDSNSKKVLGFTNREFYVISKTPDGIETKLYSGSWQTQAEFTASVASATGGTQASTTSSTTTTTTATATTTTTVQNTTGSSATGTANTTTGSQVVNGVPQSSNPENTTPYVIGSSAILSTIPASTLNSTGGLTGGNTPAPPTSQSSSQASNINITALANSIAGLEALGYIVARVVSYHFNPSSPGSSLFKGLNSSQFLTAALEVHPKTANGKFDEKYIQYCNALNLPVGDPNSPVTSPNQNNSGNR